MTANLCHDPADAASRERRESETTTSDGQPDEHAADEPSTTDESTATDTPDVASAELLALLGDEYACDILRALGDGPLPAADLVETCGMSRPTVYRRLDRLTAAGIVEARMQPDRDGHHRQVFHLALEAIQFQIRADGIESAVSVADD